MQWSTALKYAGYLIFSIALIIGGLYFYEYNPRSCSESSSAYSTQTILDPTISFSESYTKVEGVSGVFRTCKSWSGKKVSSRELVKQVNAIRVEGTYDPVILHPRDTYNISGGSVCNDGTYSLSTGRGTCSWHGGVAY